MKKQHTKKLTLNRETVKNLQEKHLAVAYGGSGFYSCSACNPCTNAN